MRRLGRRNITSGKTGILDDLSILPALAAELAHLPRNRLRFLTTAEEAGQRAAGFDNALADWCTQAGTPQRSLRGFRTAVATLIAQGGGTGFQVMPVLAHACPKEAARDTRKALHARHVETALALPAGLEGERTFPSHVARLDKGAAQMAENISKIP